MLIWTSFDSFTIIYLTSLLQKFHFLIEVVPNSLQTKKDLEVAFRSQFFVEFFDKYFLL